MTIRVLAVIPARVGSQRLPRKNFSDLGGESLAQRAYRVACEAAEQLRDLSVADVFVAVSTDADLPAGYFTPPAEYRGGCATVMRPPELAEGNAAGGWPAGMVAPGHALGALSSVGHHFDGVLLLQPTSPFRSAERIVEAVRWWKQLGCTRSVISGCVPGLPNGAIYLTHAERFQQAKSWGFADAYWTLMKPSESLDIDCEWDLMRARQQLEADRQKHEVGK